jgi:hypothetical protein
MMNTIAIFQRWYKPKKSVSLLICLFLLTACESYLSPDDPTGQIPLEEIFKDESSATAIISTLYAKLRDEVLVTGSTQGMGVLMGWYADELEYLGAPGQASEAFFQHQIIPSNATVLQIWNNSYSLIYMTNAAIEGLEASKSLSEEIKNQLLGEALFVRGMVHFYLVNLFGDIPYITTTNHTTNSTVSRMKTVKVYEKIILDGMNAKARLGANYVSNERIRANQWVASALLARVYLYARQWENAENESSLIISNISLYNLPRIEEVFLKTSPSAILQLKTKSQGNSTYEANIFTFTSTPPPLLALNNDLVSEMEINDLRKTNWIKEVKNASDIWYHPNKYKKDSSLEYSTIFRLAEQYLIRAEARVRQNDLIGAKKDINTIRQRAGLQNTTATTEEELLKAVFKERRFELFTEHGHRWFDLRRSSQAEEILSQVKHEWKSTDILLPIPDTELLMNANLNPQNPGY